MSSDSKRYLFVKHSENWNVDRCTRWMEEKQLAIDWCYPASDQAFPDAENYAGVIVFGGANSANDCHCHDWVRREHVFVEQCLKLNTPYFGICLGAQVLARVLGADVRAHDKEIKEVGYCRVDPEPGHTDFLDSPLMVMQWHTEGFDLPPGTQRIATGEEFPNQAYSLSEKIIGVQFHPEVNAEVLAIWQERNRLRVPGQLSDDDRARMMSDAYLHDRSVTQWLDGFLTQWTSS